MGQIGGFSKTVGEELDEITSRLEKLRNHLTIKDRTKWESVAPMFFDYKHKYIKSIDYTYFSIRLIHIVHHNSMNIYAYNYMCIEEALYIFWILYL